MLTVNPKMSAIPRTAIGQAAITLNSPWANKLLSLRSLANPPSITPPQLMRFIPAEGTAPVAALRVVAARGGTSGGNAKTRKLKWTPMSRPRFGQNKSD
jgi:hypothetical protein